MNLSGVGCTLQSGTFNVVLGRNGAGKSRLCRRIVGLEPYHETLLLDGRRLLRADAALVFQEFVNYPSLSVRDNIASPMRARRDAREAIEARVAVLARMLGLDCLLDRRPAELSGGQQQRVAIARALAKDARVLVLDEPLANLDYKLRESLAVELKQLLGGAREQVLVYTTSDPREALQLAEHLILLDQGRVLQEGPPLDVWRSPADARAADLLSDPGVNFVRARSTEDGVELGAGAGSRVHAVCRALAGRPAPFILGVRPEHLRSVQRGSDDLCLRARVTLAETNGSDTFVHAEVAGGGWVAHLDGIHRFDEGAALDLFVSPRDLLTFDTSR